jgi:hypothetical protein
MEDGLEVAREETSGWVAESMEGGRAFVVWTKAEEMDVEREDEAASTDESRAWMDPFELLRLEPVDDVVTVGGPAALREAAGVVRRGPVVCWGWREGSGFGVERPEVELVLTERGCWDVTPRPSRLALRTQGEKKVRRQLDKLTEGSDE